MRHARTLGRYPFSCHPDPSFPTSIFAHIRLRLATSSGGGTTSSGGGMVRTDEDTLMTTLDHWMAGVIRQSMK
jgi:hypothetical protein